MRKSQAKRWSSPQERVRWLLQERWHGSRSAMARETGISLTGIVKVVTGQQEPGRRLLAAIAQTTNVNPGWLLTGQGNPFLISLPVAHHVLPGSPADWGDLLAADQVEGFTDLYSPSRYWLKIQPKDAVARDQHHKIKAGDLLLFETARSLFPMEQMLFEALCVIRLPKTAPWSFKLAAVTYVEGSIEDGPAHLEADTLDGGLDSIAQTIVEESPSGELRAFKRFVRREKIKGPRTFTKTTPIRPGEMESYPWRLTERDLMAVCILMARGFATS